MRVHQNGTIYFVTNRCHQERFLMLPRPGIIKTIGAWLGRALHKYGDGIEIFTFIFLSNHFHILLRPQRPQDFQARANEGLLVNIAGRC